MRVTPNPGNTLLLHRQMRKGHHRTALHAPARPQAIAHDEERLQSALRSELERQNSVSRHNGWLAIS